MPRKALVLILSLFAFAVTCGLLVSAFVALPVPLSPDWANRHLLPRYPLHEIGFSDPKMIWRPGDRAVELQLRKAVLRDPARDAVVSVPEIVLAIDPTALLSGRLSVRSVLLSGAVFRLERTTGGALKVDIGTTADGMSGSAVMMFLTDLASSTSDAQEGAPIPEIRVADGMLYLSDTQSGARFSFDVASARLAGVQHGAELQATLTALTSGEMIELDLTALFDSADQSLMLRIAFRNANPAILSELLPDLSVLAPIEIPLSGRIEARFGRGLSLQSARLDITGQAGSLEVAQYTGRNIAVDRVRSVLRYRRDTGQLRFDDLSLTFQGRHLTGTAQSIAIGDSLRFLSADLVLSGTSWDEVAPLWFGGIDRWQGDLAPDTDRTGPRQRLSFLARLDHAGDAIDGRGRLVSEPAGPGQPGDGNAARALEFRIGGTPVSPDLVLFAR